MSSAHATSVLYPVQAVQLAQVMPFARLLQQRGAGRLWISQSLGIETHHVFAALVGTGVHIPFGTSVALTPLRHPYDAAVQARSVARLSGQPFVAGIGPGAPEFQRMVRPSAYRRPVTAARDYLATMRALISGERVDADGCEHSTHAAIPPLDAPSIELGLGVLRPAMASAAGAVADVAITWMTPLAYLHEVLVPRLREGADSAKRTVPRVATVVHTAVDRPGRDPVALAHSAARAHLSTGHYVDMLRRAGLPADPADPLTGAELLVKSGAFLTGSAEQIAAELDRYRAAGVDEVVLNIAGVLGEHGVGAAITDLSDILTAVDGQHA